MKAGRLRHRVTIQQQTITPDGMGGGNETWSNVATVWADVTTSQGNIGMNMEAVVSDQTRTVNMFRVRIRYRSGIGTNMRLLHRGRVLEVLSIANIDERNREMILLCREGG
jgi:SPP1 family predicted phage head-tail adaptor